jgi:hypothetical protein
MQASSRIPPHRQRLAEYQTQIRESTRSVFSDEMKMLLFLARNPSRIGDGFMQHRPTLCRNLRIRLQQRCLRLQTPHYIQPPRMEAVCRHVALAIQRRLGRHGNKQLRPLQRIGSNKPLRHDPYHGERHIVDGELLPNHIRRAVKPALPEALADHYTIPRRIAALAIILRRKRAPQQWRCLQCGKELAAHNLTGHVFVSAAALHLQIRVIERKHLLKHAVPAFHAPKQRL